MDVAKGNQDDATGTFGINPRWMGFGCGFFARFGVVGIVTSRKRAKPCENPMRELFDECWLGRFSCLESVLYFRLPSLVQNHSFFGDTSLRHTKVLQSDVSVSPTEAPQASGSSM